MAQSLRFHLIVASQRHTPGNIAVGVDCGQLTPRRPLARIAIRVDKALIATLVAPLHRRTFGCLDHVARASEAAGVDKDITERRVEGDAAPVATTHGSWKQ